MTKGESVMYKVLVGVNFASIVFLMYEIGYVFSKMKSKIHMYLFFNCVATLVNNLGYLMEMTSQSEAEYLAALKMSYLGKVWVPFSLLIFTFAVCKINFPKVIGGILALIHGATFFVVLSCETHSLYYVNMTYVEDDRLFSYITSSPGIWHKVYMSMLVVYIIVGLSQLFVVTYREKNQIARKRYLFVTIAITTESLGFLVNMTGVTSPYDCTGLGYTIGSLFMFIAMYKYKLLETLELAKDYVIDELSEAIVSVNQFGQPEFYNKPAQELLKRRSLSVKECLQETEKAIEGNYPLRLDGRVYSPQVKPLYSDGILKGKIYVLTDDTKHYEYMEELKKQKDIAERLSASKSSFMSIVSHEIRTPMNAVVGMTELLLRQKASFTEKQIKYLQNIKNSGAALVMIVNDILDQSKIEAGKMEIVAAPYEIRPLLSDIKMIIENRVGSKSVAVECDIDNSVPRYLVGDGLRIRQVLINLMNNSVKFTDEGFVRLSIKCVADDENARRKQLRFAVSDSGMGIKPMDLCRLGEAFTQVDTTVNYGKEGTGLGLSISKNFIELMGGNLEISSQYGTGSEFSFTIWQGVEDVVSDSSSLNDSTDDFTAPDARALVVDDTDINLMIIEELLAPVGIAVDKARSGDKAIKMIAEHNYDIVFMDYVMTSMNGVETTQKVRSMGIESGMAEDDARALYFRSVPIIAMSGDTSQETHEKFINAGINDFIDKPVDVAHLKSMILKWVNADKIERQ